MDTTKKRVPALNERKQAIFFRIFKLVNKRGEKQLGYPIYYLGCSSKRYGIQIDNGTMNLIYSTKTTYYKYNINDLESCDIAVLKDCLMDVIYAMRNE